jgi:hypothetical protein
METMVRFRVSSWRCSFASFIYIHMPMNVNLNDYNICCRVFGSFNAYCPTIEKVVPCLSD